MRSLWFASALLVTSLSLSACQPSSYVLVQLDGVPEAARSVKILVQRGSQVSTPLPALALPNTGTAGLSFRLDLPAAGEDPQPIEIQVGAFSRAGAEGCLLAHGGTRVQPREAASVHLDTIASVDRCSEGDVFIESVAPNLLSTEQLATSELVVKGWGFQPDTQVSIDGGPVARLSFVSTTEVRLQPAAAQRTGLQPISAQNQGGRTIAEGLLRYYSNQVTYTAMANSQWVDLGISAGSMVGMAGTALINYDSGGPRFSVLATESEKPARWDMLIGFRIFGMPASGKSDKMQGSDTLFQTNVISSPKQIIVDHFDVEPLDDVLVLDDRQNDAQPAYKVGFSASIARDVSYNYCSNIVGITPRIDAIAARNLPMKPVANLLLAYSNGVIGELEGTPRGLFLGPTSQQPNLCDLHEMLPTGVFSSLQSLLRLSLSPKDENYLVVANGGAGLFQVPSPDTSITGAGVNAVTRHLHTPVLISDMKTSPISHVIVDDINQDTIQDIAMLIRHNSAAFIKIYRGLPSVTVQAKKLAQFDMSIPEFPLPHDCAQVATARLVDINEDGYADLLYSCFNSDGQNSIEALLSRGAPMQYNAMAQTVFLRGPSVGGSLHFERMPQFLPKQAIELWGGNGVQPFRLINTSH